MKINKRKLLATMLLAMTLLGCQQDIYRFNSQFSLPKKSEESPLVLFIGDKDYDNGKVTHSTLSKALDYTKIPFSTIETVQFDKNPVLPFTTRIIVVNNTIDFSDKSIETLLSFIAKGGTVFFTELNKDERITFFLGLKTDADRSINTTANGFYTLGKLFPEKEHMTLPGKTSHSGFASTNFSKEVDLLVVAANEHEYPLLVKNAVGKGMVLYYNAKNPMPKVLRGLAFSALLMGLEGIPYPVANVATIFLDDFPSPTYPILKEPIKSELGKNITEYVKDVWWPDMKKLASEEHIKYTAYVTFDYNSNTKPPFGFREWDENKFLINSVKESSSTWLGKDILASGHELGWHGYNHISLTKENWGNTQYMVMGLKAAEKKWKILGFGDLTKSYVPPSNIIDSVGLAKLHEGMPYLRYMQSVYLGVETEYGENREFDVDPYNSSFFDFPRISSGYYMNDVNAWNIESLYMCTGIWTHFLHPDDVYQLPDESNAETSGDYEYRNKLNLPWYSKNGKTGLLDTFKGIVKDYKKRHPYTRFFNATQGAEETVEWRFGYYNHTNYDGVYEVENFRKKHKNEPDFWLMYVSEDHIAEVDRNLRDQFIEFEKRNLLHGKLYSIKTKDAALTVPDLNPRVRRIYNDEEEVVKLVRNEYELFQKNREFSLPLEEVIKRYIAKDNVGAATNLIEEYLKVNPRIGTSIIKQYAQLMVWQQREGELWKNLDIYYNRYKNKANAEISREIKDIAGYPSEAIRKNWLERQIGWKTLDKDALNEYYTSFNTIENKENIRYVLETLGKLSPTEENAKRLIQYLIDTQATDLVAVLDQVEPCAYPDEKLATSIAWAYADRLMFHKALQWEPCAAPIAKETLEYWNLNSSDFEKKKETDYPFYIALLLANDGRAAYQELRRETPCKEEIRHLAKAIAMNLADFGDYKKALAWSECTSEIPIKQQLSWYFETNQVKKMKSVFNAYVADHPKSSELRNYMAMLMLYSGEVMESARAVSTLPIHEVDAEYKAALNKEIKNMDIRQQMAVYLIYPQLLEKSLIQEIQKKVREKEADFIGVESFAQMDKFRPTAWDNMLYYQRRNRKGNVHKIGATRSFMYSINIPDVDPINTDRNLWGLEYKYTANHKEVASSWYRARIERDNEGKVYGQAGLGYGYSRKSNYTSIQLDAFPVRTGPAHVLNIYRTVLTGYKEIGLSKAFRQILAVEGNYYTDDEFQGVGMTRLDYAMVNLNQFKMVPHIEGSYSRGTTDRRQGFPYWMADERLYGGGGMRLDLFSPESKFNLSADAAYFWEQDQPEFQRYTGRINYRIKETVFFKAACEVYTIKNFFSNVYTAGMSVKF